MFLINHKLCGVPKCLVIVADCADYASFARLPLQRFTCRSIPYICILAVLHIRHGCKAYVSLARLLTCTAVSCLPDSTTAHAWRTVISVHASNIYG